MLKLVNWVLKPLGLVLVPRYSAKMLTETANTLETVREMARPVDAHPRPGNTVLWLRAVAEILHAGGDEYKPAQTCWGCPGKEVLHLHTEPGAPIARFKANYRRD